MYLFDCLADKWEQCDDKGIAPLQVQPHYIIASGGKSIRRTDKQKISNSKTKDWFRRFCETAVWKNLSD